MAAPGIQISEIWHALVRCKDIYNAFKSGHENAAAILASFKDDLARVEQALEFHKFLFAKTGKQFPGAVSFKAVLTRCADFLSSNKQLLDRNQGEESFAGVYQTVVSVFKNEIPTFRIAISQKIQEFSDWKINLLLELAFARAEQPVAASSAHSATDLGLERQYQADDQLRQDVNELVSIIYTHGRLLKSGHLSAARGRASPGARSLSEAELTSMRLEARFSITMASICRRGNMPDDYRPRSVTLQELSGYVGSNRQEATIQSFSGTTRYQRHPAMIFPRSVCVRIWIDAGKKKYQLEAAGYVFVGRQFIFFDAGGRPISEHRVNQDCRPFTQRTVVKNEPNERLVVEFLDPQELTIFQHEGLVPRNHLLDVGRTKEEPLHACPKYWFAQRHRDEYIQFQSDLRGVKLYREFHVRTITSKRSTAGSDADQVRVKLWCDDRKPDQTFLSSLAEFQDVRMIFEWPLRWFEFPDKIDDNVARLKFRLPPEQPPSPVIKSGSRSPRAWIGRVITRHSRRSSANTIPTVTTGTSTAPSSIRSVENSDYAESSWLTKVEYMDFKFEAPMKKDMPGVSSYRDDFVRAVRHLQASLRSPVLSTLPPSTFESLLESPEIASHFGSPCTPGTSPDTAIAGPSNTRSTDIVERQTLMLSEQQQSSDLSSSFDIRTSMPPSPLDVFDFHFRDPQTNHHADLPTASQSYAEQINVGVTPATPRTFLSQVGGGRSPSAAPVPIVATPQTYLHPGR